MEQLIKKQKQLAEEQKQLNEQIKKIEQRRQQINNGGIEKLTVLLEEQDIQLDYKNHSKTHNPNLNSKSYRELQKHNQKYRNQTYGNQGILLSYNLLYYNELFHSVLDTLKKQQVEINELKIKKDNI